MSENIRVGGNVNIKVGGTTRWYAKEGVEINSNGYIDYFAPKYTYGDPQDPPLKEGVKEIELITPLEDGSANDLSGNLQKGMIFGNTYQFKVKSYVNNVPSNINNINWMIKYHSLSENKWIEIPLSAKGDNIKIVMAEEDLCGRFVYVRAYLKYPEKESELKIWKHNRFRWFDRKQLKQEIEDRIINSYLIDQGGSSMCGIAVVGFNFARENGQVYKNFILDIHRKGKAKNALTGYKLVIDNDQHLIEYKQTDIVYPEESLSTKKMALADFIFLICLKDNMNSVFDYDPNGPNAGGIIEGGTGLTLPHEVAQLMKDMANYKDVINDTNLVMSRSRSASVWVNKLQDKLKLGYRIGLLIDSDNFSKNKKSIFTVPTHWVGLIDINCNDITELVDVNVYTWGGTRIWTLSYDVFKDGFFGYIAGK